MKKINNSLIPYRIDLAGGWFDQPFLSQRYPGAVLTISIESNYCFSDRSGMATSTRRKAKELWGNELPNSNEESLAKILFCCDNPPGSQSISGAQDSIGIIYKGLTRQYYAGAFWPQFIDRVLDNNILDFIQSHLIMIPLKPRVKNYDPLSKCDMRFIKIKEMSNSVTCCWDSIINMNLKDFGQYMTQCFYNQVAMFPNMMNKDIQKYIEKYNDKLFGYKISGAGGGGYFIGLTNENIDGSFKIKIRR